jgi:hypothetical protein
MTSVGWLLVFRRTMGFGISFYFLNEKTLWFQVQSRVNFRHLFEKF